MPRLTERDRYGFAYIRGTDAIDMEERNDEAIEKLADYEDAEEQGRILVLPKKMVRSELLQRLNEMLEILNDTEMTIYNLRNMMNMTLKTMEKEKDNE